jgi:hypothetical protein
MKKDWHGLVKILEIQHIRDGKVIWEEKNLLNTLHIGGEMFMLTCAFDSSPGTYPPANYYFGLDNRGAITVDDLMTDIIDEPSGNGYLRQAVSSSNQFTIDIVSGVYRATSQIVTFSATGSGWGPVSNLFMATSVDGSGILLASNPLSNSITLTNGDAINMRMALALRDVPT